MSLRLWSLWGKKYPIEMAVNKTSLCFLVKTCLRFNEDLFKISTESPSFRMFSKMFFDTMGPGVRKEKTTPNPFIRMTLVGIAELLDNVLQALQLGESTHRKSRPIL